MPAASIAVVLATAQPFTKRLFDLFERPLRAWAVGATTGRRRCPRPLRWAGPDAVKPRLLL